MLVLENLNRTHGLRCLVTAGQVGLFSFRPIELPVREE